MLFFRSEEMLRQWCEERAVEPRPIVTMTQLWSLSVHWYATRLTPSARRPGRDEMRRIFAEIGLTDSFWDPTADAFR